MRLTAQLFILYIQGNAFERQEHKHIHQHARNMPADQSNGDSLAAPLERMRLRSRGPIDMQQHISAARANINTANSSQLPSLQSLGLVNDTSRFSISLHDCYVRSSNIEGTYNINASFVAVKTLIRQRRVQLVKDICTLLGNDPDKWFAPRFRPYDLPSHPLDWSTMVLREMHLLAASTNNFLTADQRRAAVHQSMREASDNPQEEPVPVSHEETTASHHAHGSFMDSAAEDQDVKDRIEGLEEEMFDLFGRQADTREDFRDLKREMDDEITALKTKAADLRRYCVDLELSLTEVRRAGPVHDEEV